jgi:hypothetical protein
MGGEGRRWGQGGEMTQTLYAHMNKKKIKKKFSISNGQNNKGRRIKGHVLLFPSCTQQVL